MATIHKLLISNGSLTLTTTTCYPETNTFDSLHIGWVYSFDKPGDSTALSKHNHRRYLVVLTLYNCEHAVARVVEAGRKGFKGLFRLSLTLLRARYPLLFLGRWNTTTRERCTFNSGQIGIITTSLATSTVFGVCFDIVTVLTELSPNFYARSMMMKFLLRTSVFASPEPKLCS